MGPYPIPNTSKEAFEKAEFHQILSSLYGNYAKFIKQLEQMPKTHQTRQQARELLPFIERVARRL